MKWYILKQLHIWTWMYHVINQARTNPASSMVKYVFKMINAPSNMQNTLFVQNIVSRYPRRKLTWVGNRSIYNGKVCGALRPACCSICCFKTCSRSPTTNPTCRLIFHWVRTTSWDMSTDLSFRPTKTRDFYLPSSKKAKQSVGSLTR